MEIILDELNDFILRDQMDKEVGWVCSVDPANNTPDVSSLSCFDLKSKQIIPIYMEVGESFLSIIDALNKLSSEIDLYMKNINNLKKKNALKAKQILRLLKMHNRINKRRNNERICR